MSTWKRYLPSFRNLSRGVFLIAASLCCNIILGISWANIFSFIIAVGGIIALIYAIEEGVEWLADKYENWRKN